MKHYIAFVILLAAIAGASFDDQIVYAANHCGINVDCWVRSGQDGVNDLPSQPGPNSPPPSQGGTGGPDVPTDDVTPLPDLPQIPSPPGTGGGDVGRDGGGGGGAGAGGPIEFPNPLRYKSIVEIVDRIATYLMYLAVAVAPLLILVGAFYIMSAGGNKERLSTGKKYIIYAAIGFVLAIGAKGVMGLIKAAIGIE